MDDRQNDSAITVYGTISEKDYLTKAVRDMSRQLVGKTSGQEKVWNQCPNNWPSELLGEWKNPTSTQKDNVVLLKKKYEFLKQNVPPDKFSDIQKNCFRLYDTNDRDKMDKLSQYSNLVKIKVLVEKSLRYMSSISSCDPLVRGKEMEVRDVMKQFLSSDLNSEASYKRKNSTSTCRSTKKRRVVSPSVLLSEQCNSAQCPPRPIQPKPDSPPTATTTASLNHPTTLTSIPSNHSTATTTVSFDYTMIPTSVPSNLPTAKTGLTPNHETAISTSVSDSVITTPSFKLPDVQDITNTLSDCATTTRDQLHLYTEDQLPLPSPPLYKSSPSQDSGVPSVDAISSPEDHDRHSSTSPQEEEDVESGFEDFFLDDLMGGQTVDDDKEIQDATRDPDIQNVIVDGLKKCQKKLSGH